MPLAKRLIDKANASEETKQHAHFWNFTNPEGEKIIHCLVKFNTQEAQDMLQFLLQIIHQQSNAYTILQAREPVGCNALHYAVSAKSIKMQLYLLISLHKLSIRIFSNE